MHKQIFRYILFIILSSTISVLAQDEKIYNKVDIPPKPSIGLKGWKKYLKDNLHYPEKAKDAKVEGTVLVQFVVNEDGTISAPLILKGIGFGCDQEAQRLLKESPKWNPGEINQSNGTREKVKTRVTTPVRFVLD
ncbi:MAG: energy transducer TonB [Bacteroidota bacterium]